MDRLSSDFQKLLYRYQPLTAAEERKLVEQYGRDRARLEELLVLHNLQFAKQMATRYHERTESKDDLFTIAILGLVRAANEYEPSRNMRFTTFAYHKIRSAFGIITNEMRSDVQMQRATMAVLDAPRDDEDGEERAADCVPLNVSSDYQPIDPGRVHAVAAEERECAEWLHSIDICYLRRESPKNRAIALRILRGGRKSDVARSFGMSRETLYQRMKPVFERLRKAIKKEVA